MQHYRAVLRHVHEHFLVDVLDGKPLFILGEACQLGLGAEYYLDSLTLEKARHVDLAPGGEGREDESDLLVLVPARLLLEDVVRVLVLVQQELDSTLPHLFGPHKDPHLHVALLPLLGGVGYLDYPHVRLLCPTDSDLTQLDLFARDSNCWDSQFGAVCCSEGHLLCCLHKAGQPRQVDGQGVDHQQVSLSQRLHSLGNHSVRPHRNFLIHVLNTLDQF